MKKTIVLIMSLSMLLCSCKEQDSKNAEVDNSSILTSAETESRDDQVIEETDVSTEEQLTEEVVESESEETDTTIVKEYTASDIELAYNWITGDIWNKGLCDISHFIESGLDSMERELDIDFCVSNLSINYAKRDEFDSIIHALDDSIPEQAQLVLSWDKAMEQADILINKVTTETPHPQDATYEFNTDLFQQYYKSFLDTYRGSSASSEPKNYVFK